MALPTNRITRNAFLSLKANVNCLTITYKIIKTAVCLVPVGQWFRSVTGSNKLLVPVGHRFHNITGYKSLLDSVLHIGSKMSLGPIYYGLGCLSVSSMLMIPVSY